MMTPKELSEEFWLLTQAVLQDGTIETNEARVIKRWLEEHAQGDQFAYVLGKLDKLLEDGYIDRFESAEVIEAIATVLRTLRKQAESSTAQ